METLRAHAAQCRFDAARGCFTFCGQRKRGLTPVLAAAHNVPAHNRTTCAGCVAERRARSSARVAARAAGFGSRTGPMFQSRKRQRRGDADLIVVGRATSVPRCRGSDPRAHGSIVDDDIGRVVAGGYRRGVGERAALDPCALSLLAYVRDTLKWRPVLAQVPIHSARLNVSTAIDLVCVDARARVCIVEVKSTSRVLTRQGRGCYHAPRGPADAAAAAAPPRSLYAHNQWQLWAMVECLRDEIGVDVADACVLRTSPGGVDHYPLNPWFAENADALRAQLTTTCNVADAT